MANDSYSNSSWRNSSVTQITARTPGNVTLISPTNNNYTIHARTPTFIWSTTNFTTYYEINITSNHCPDLFGNVTYPTTNYTPGSELCLESESGGGTYYNWTVRACGIDACSPWASKWNFSIEPYVAITLVTGSINFGSVLLGEIKSTESGSPPPFALQNDGNVKADLVNVSSNMSLWQSPGAGLGTKYLQMKARNSSETGAFNMTTSITSWVNVTLTNTSIIRDLDYNNSNDLAYLDLQIEVPGDEPEGQKQTYLIFSWEQTP